jgi:hypothetical protein
MAGDRPSSHETKRDRQMRRRVERAYPEQLRGHPPCQSRGRAESDDDAEANLHERASDEQPLNLAGSRAKRETDANLTPTLRGGITDME